MIVMNKTTAKTTFLKSLSWINTVALLLAIIVVGMSCNSGVADALSAPKPPSQQHNKNWLVVDFDGTCTVRDTIAMLPRLAALAKSKQQQADFNLNSSNEVLSPDAVIDFQGRLSIFSILENDYFRKYTDVLQTIQPEADEAPAAADLLEQLAESIDKLDTVSTEITHEVSKWRVLGGLGDISHTEMLDLIEMYKENQAELEPQSIGDLETNTEELLECLALKKGCLSVLRNSIVSRNYDIGVLSINWCPALIESLLVHPLCCAVAAAAIDKNENETLIESLPRLEDVPIWSNSVDGDGIVALPFPGAISKREQIVKLQQRQPQQQGGIASVAPRVVYVGDSSTDLLAILQADVGILLGGSKSAAGLATRYGVMVKPLSDYKVCTAAERDESSLIVWTADHWDEIESFLDRT